MTHEAHHHEHSGRHHAAAGTDGETVECPVMPGSTVNKAEAEQQGLYRDYQGTRYYFCCAACPPLWDADPEKYAA